MADGFGYCIVFVSMTQFYVCFDFVWILIVDIDLLWIVFVWCERDANPLIAAFVEIV